MIILIHSHIKKTKNKIILTVSEEIFEQIFLIIRHEMLKLQKHSNTCVFITYQNTKFYCVIFQSTRFI